MGLRQQSACERVNESSLAFAASDAEFRRSQYGAFNTALRSLYKDDILQLAKEKKQPFEFNDKLFEDAASLVYDNGGFDISQLEDPAARAVINETLRVLSIAIDSGLPHEVPETVRYALENNAFVFSGFKTFHSMREIGLSMVTDKGDIKPFNDFMADVRKINQLYNHNYLYAEYNHAVGTSLMAAKWHEFEQDGDRYNLQYRTAGDNHVREEHALLHGTTLPPSDPFWDKYYPPNGWNCRCTVEQVLKDKYPLSDADLAMKRGDNCTDGVKQRMFRYNPGKSLQLFPPKHPYYKTPTDAKPIIEDVARHEHNRTIYERLENDSNYTDVEFDENTGGVKATHVGHNFDKIGGKYEQDALIAGVKAGNAVILENEKGEGKHTEGLWNGTLFEVAGCETGSANNILRGLKHCASKRETEVAVIVLPNSDFDKVVFETAIKRFKGLEKLNDGQYLKFKKIICVHNQEVVYITDGI